MNAKKALDTNPAKSLPAIQSYALAFRQVGEYFLSVLPWLVQVMKLCSDKMTVSMAYESLESNMKWYLGHTGGKICFPEVYALLGIRDTVMTMWSFSLKLMSIDFLLAIIEQTKKVELLHKRFSIMCMHYMDDATKYKLFGSNLLISCKPKNDNSSSSCIMSSPTKPMSVVVDAQTSTTDAYVILGQNDKFNQSMHDKKQCQCYCMCEDHKYDLCSKSI